MPSPMYSPAHAGHALRASLQGMKETYATKRTGALRPTLSSRCLIVAPASRLKRPPGPLGALGTHPGLWYDRQTDYDLAQARGKKLPKIPLLSKAASGGPGIKGAVRRLQGLKAPGRRSSPQTSRRAAPEDLEL